jgi:hypothetical protein
MITCPPARPFARLIHDADRNAYEAALSEGWHLVPQAQSRIMSAPETEPYGAYLRRRRAVLNLTQRRCG